MGMAQGGDLRHRFVGGDSLSARSGLWVRGLFALTVLLFAVQLAGIYLTRTQPYPALTMPGFAGTPTDSGVVDWAESLVRVEAEDGTWSEADLVEVLPSETGVLDSSVVRNAFGDEKFTNDSRTVTWLHHRLEATFPGQEIVRAQIIWREAEYNINSGNERPSYRNEEIIDITFGDKS